jgi:hypothetical protein
VREKSKIWTDEVELDGKFIKLKESGSLEQSSQDSIQFDINGEESEVKKSPEIKWKNKVHEVLVGYKQYTSLPEVPALSINHTKTIEKQEKQNSYYNTL